MTVDVPSWAGQVVAELPYPPIFATVSGAHLYGFASADSDLDLRAAHLLPAAEVVGLRTGPLRVLLTGLHLMRTGELETDSPRPRAPTSPATYPGCAPSSKRRGTPPPFPSTPTVPPSRRCTS